MGMKISEIITDKYKLRIPPTVYYELLADVQELEEEQEPTTKNDLGVDAVSRQQAIERLKLNFPISQGADNSRDRYRYMQALADIQAIRELPSVTPQEPKTGRWIDNKCTNCGYEVQPWNTTNYYPNCGAFCGGDNNG